jgi:transcriptional regulator with XRE-family HTH domain
MLTLRTKIGLTQAELADQLGIRRLTVCRWEAGSAYPKPEHLKALIALAVQYQAFPTGQETEEIRTLWKVARQKVLFDERWLSLLLSEPPSQGGLQIVPPQEAEQELGQRVDPLPPGPVEKEVKPATSGLKREGAGSAPSPSQMEMTWSGRK